MSNQWELIGNRIISDVFRIFYLDFLFDVVPAWLHTTRMDMYF